MTEVHLIYTGIVGLVPVGDRLTVVVQDARNGGHGAHIPHVVIEEGALVSFSNLPDLGTQNELRGFLLDHYDIAVGTPIQDTTFYKDSNFGEFVLDLRKGCPSTATGRGVFDRNLLNGAIPNSVAARMPLPNGMLATTFVAPYDQWYFKDLGGNPEHLAEEICHKFQIDGSILTLSFAKTAGAPGELQVKLPQAQPTIEVRIGNLPYDLVFKRILDTTPTDDHHVKLYYDLAANPPTDRKPLIYTSVSAPLPHPPQETHTHRLTPQGGQLVRGPNCPPALWV
jgi:hypothetical protein